MRRPCTFGRRAVGDPAVQVGHWLAAGAWDDAVRELADLDAAALAWRPAEDLAGWVAWLPDAVRARYPALAAGLARLQVERAYGMAGAELGLTRRQTEVLLLLAEGATNEEIAARLVVALPTVKGHVGQILRKLGVESRARRWRGRRSWEFWRKVANGRLCPILLRDKRQTSCQNVSRNTCRPRKASFPWLQPRCDCSILAYAIWRICLCLMAMWLTLS